MIADWCVMQGVNLYHIYAYASTIGAGSLTRYDCRLVCDARGEPPPDVFWTRENKDKIIITDKNTGRRTAGQ